MGGGRARRAACGTPPPARTLARPRHAPHPHPPPSPPAVPLFPGSRLTAYELVHDGLPATLICDSAAASLLIWGGEGGGSDDGAPAFTGRPHAVIVGADRVAANGDTANKVGTLALAVAAKRAG